MKVWDLHCDTLSELRYAQLAGKPKSFAKSDLHIDLEKLQKGDYMLQCLGAFVNLGRQKQGEDPLVAALEEFDLFHRILEKYPDQVAPVYAAGDIARNAAAGKISLMLTIEEGGCCKGSLGVLRQLYALGARMMTLTWNYPNELANPNLAPGDEADVLPCRPNTETGLTEKGFAFLAEMERLHMTVDVSHLSDKGFWDIVAHGTRPFAASHSNCRALAPHSRNLTDEMIRAMAERGCLAGLNYCAGFLEPDPAAQASTVDRIAEHAAHFKQVGGIEMIALGSDFDGIEHMPGMQNCGDLPLLEQALRRHGFSEDEIEAIFFGNARRFFTQNL
ncbi:MAG: dipeptidase [Faecalibacterium sp.]|jgi:membrane dipeptidase|nr:dipeptidase [Faecalibacterium sp.]